MKKHYIIKEKLLKLKKILLEIGQIPSHHFEAEIIHLDKAIDYLIESVYNDKSNLNILYEFFAELTKVLPDFADIESEDLILADGKYIFRILPEKENLAEFVDNISLQFSKSWKFLLDSPYVKAVWIIPVREEENTFEILSRQ